MSILFLKIFLSTFFLTVIFEKLGHTPHLLDHPIKRSAHSYPIPSGGGAVVVIVFLVVATSLFLNDRIPVNEYHALMGGSLIAVLGFADDVSSLSLWVRLPTQFVAAFWVVYSLGGVPSIDFSFFQLSNSEILILLGVLALIWLLNLYNFMDGADGLAGTELIFVTSMSLVFAIIAGDNLVALISAILISSISGFPSVVILLISGLFIGRSGLGLVEPLDLGQGLETIVGLLVCLVLFEGGLNLKLPEGNIRNTVLRISLIRLFISLSAGIFIAHWLAGLSWPVAGVYSAIVLATGPTVVSPLVDQIKLVSPLSEVLKAEGLVLEPIGAVLALLLLELILGDLHGIKEVFIALMQRLGGGVLIGISSGWLLSEILKKIKNETSFGIELQVTLGFIFLVYGICEYILPESGLPASVAAGFIVGKREIIDKERLDNLIGELAQLAITVLFPLLASDVSWGELSPLGWGGIICVLMLMIIVRPISISLATMGGELDVKQRVFLSWLAPRGIVTAAVASLFSIRLEQAGVLGAGRLQGLVFLTILMTVGIQGLTARPLANFLNLIDKEI